MKKLKESLQQLQKNLASFIILDSGGCVDTNATKTHISYILSDCKLEDAVGWILFRDRIDIHQTSQHVNDMATELKISVETVSAMCHKTEMYEDIMERQIDITTFLVSAHQVATQLDKTFLMCITPCVIIADTVSHYINTLEPMRRQWYIQTPKEVDEALKYFKSL